MKLTARIILVLLGVAVFGVVLFGLPYWTRDGMYVAGTNMYWFLLGPIVLGSLFVLVLVIEGVSKLMKVAGWYK